MTQARECLPSKCEALVSKLHCCQKRKKKKEYKIKTVIIYSVDM
jgi:hypothetical protein